MIKSKSISYETPAEAKCACGANIVWYRTTCTECIEKQVAENIKRHLDNLINPINLTNHEISRFNHYN